MQWFVCALYAQTVSGLETTRWFLALGTVSPTLLPHAPQEARRHAPHTHTTTHTRAHTCTHTHAHTHTLTHHTSILIVPWCPRPFPPRSTSSSFEFQPSRGDGGGGLTGPGLPTHSSVLNKHTHTHTHTHWTWDDLSLHDLTTCSWTRLRSSSGWGSGSLSVSSFNFPSVVKSP